MAFILAILLISLLNIVNSLPVPEQHERNFTDSVSNWINSIYASGAYTNKLIRTPLNLEAVSEEQLNSVMESLCNMTQFMHFLAIINSTQSQDLYLVLENAVLEGCKLVKANVSGEYNLTECTTEDLLSIQTTCVSRQLAPALTNILRQTRRQYAPHFFGYNETKLCNWLKERVPGSESVQEALNCSTD